VKEKCRRKTRKRKIQEGTYWRQMSRGRVGGKRGKRINEKVV
jgi:hypothetical protein